MSELFKGKYRIPSARLANYDYGAHGMYFVTICTKEMACYFGDIVSGNMQLSEIGKTAETEWYKTAKMRPDMNLELDEFVVMPNHVHGIIIIHDNPYNSQHNLNRQNHDIGWSTDNGNKDGRDAMPGVSTPGTPKTTTKPKVDPGLNNQFGPQRKNLASIIRGFKSAVTTYARKNDIEFSWQPRYHDHIIRSKKELNNIRQYIMKNPGKWEEDKNHPDNL